MEIPVVGLSLEPTNNSLFDKAQRLGPVPKEFIDIRDVATVYYFVSQHQPSVITHMAEKPLYWNLIILLGKHSKLML